MQCPICGNDNKNGTKFCTKCGHKFEKESEKNILNYDQMNMYMNDEEYYSDEEETESKKGISTLKLTAIFVVVFLILGGAGITALHFGLLDSSNEHYSKNLRNSSNSNSKKSEKAEATTFEDEGIAPDEATTEDFYYGWNTAAATTENMQATTEDIQATTQDNNNQNSVGDNSTSGSQEITLSGVNETNIPNYNNYLSPDNYEKLTVDSNFSFSYPSGFFSKVEQYNKNYTFSTSDNSDTLYVSCESGSGDAVKDVKDAANKNASLINAKEEKHGVLVVSDKVKDGWAHCIVGGNYTDGQNGNGMYKVIVSNGSSIYTLDYEYGSSDSSTYYTAQNYMLDCMYRYCEHSGTTYKPRTWEMFSKDQMGEKKTS